MTPKTLLQMLDLTGLVPSFGETLGAGGVKEYLQSAESLELRHAILGLRQLTSLHLRNVICLAAHSGLAVNFGSLANLRFALLPQESLQASCLCSVMARCVCPCCWNVWQVELTSLPMLWLKEALIKAAKSLP